MSDKLITLANLEAFKTKADALYAKSSAIPTKTSQLTNDSGFLTSSTAVTTNTAQTISGAKTFSSCIQANGGVTIKAGQNLKLSASKYPYVQLQVTEGTTSSGSPVVINLPSTSGTLALTTDGQGDLDSKANDDEVVKLTGDQTIAGAKTFSGVVNANGGLYIGGNSTATRLDSTYSGGSPITINLPSSAGTLALTSDIPSSSGSSQLYRHDIRLYGEDGGDWEAEVFVTAYNTINRAMTEAEIQDYLNNGSTNIFNATGYAYSGSSRLYVSVYRVAYWYDEGPKIAICAAGGDTYTEYMELTGYVELADTFDYQY